MTKHQGWIATLSNGEIAFEGTPQLGERTPWQQLIDFTKEKQISITRLVLRRGDTRVIAMPPKQCDGYYQAYEVLKIMFQDVDVTKQGIGSVVGDQVYISWINEAENTVTQEVRPLEGSLAHTTLRD